MPTLPIPDALSCQPDGSRAIRLPEDAVTQGFAILARRRSGKSVTAGVMEEEFLRRGDPFIVLDPASAHWGIRYRAQERAGAALQPSGFNVMIVGGEHGDIELNPAAGRQLAEIIVETNISVVLDLLMVGATDRKRFVCDLVNRLFEVNRTPRHVIVEEAHELVPQSPRFPEQVAVLAALERLIKGGGGRGIGFTLISQRPAAVNKDVLTQIDNLLVMRMSGPTDLKAVKEWFEHNVGDKAELQRVLGTLPHLKPGEAWIIGSDWVGRAERCQVRQRVTYHAGRTPKRGEEAPQVKQYDVGEVAARFKALVKEKKAAAEQKQQTEKELRARILELERELLQRPGIDNEDILQRFAKALDFTPSGPELAGQVLSQIEFLKQNYQRVVEDGEIALAGQLAARDAEWQAKIKDCSAKLLERWREDLEGLACLVDSPLLFPPPTMVNMPPAKPMQWPSKYPPAPASRVMSSNGKLRDGAERMLAALCQWYPKAMSVSQMRSHAKLKKSGTFDAYMRDLRNGSYVELLDPAMIRATAKGRAYFGSNPMPPAPRTTEQVLEVWEPKLRDGARRILRALVGHRGRSVSYSTLYSEAQLSKSGTFDAYMRDLRNAGLVVTSKGQAAANKETLFL